MTLKFRSKIRTIILSASLLALPVQALSQERDTYRDSAPVSVEQVSGAIAAAQAAIEEARTWAGPADLKEAESDLAKARRKLDARDPAEAMDAVEDTLDDLEDLKSEKTRRRPGRN